MSCERFEVLVRVMRGGETMVIPANMVEDGDVVWDASGASHVTTGSWPDDEEEKSDTLPSMTASTTGRRRCSCRSREVLSMKIIKPGKYVDLLKPRVFHCRKCGCEFEAGFTEYTILNSFGSLSAECKCPICGADCWKPVGR